MRRSLQRALSSVVMCLAAALAVPGCGEDETPKESAPAPAPAADPAPVKRAAPAPRADARWAKLPKPDAT